MRQLGMDKRDAATVRVATPSPASRFRLYALCLAGGLLVGLLPTGYRLYQVQHENGELHTQLMLVEMEAQLARAAVLARHGDYAGARDAASGFFSSARTAVDNRTDLSNDERTRLLASLAERDTLITLLARSDPAGAERAAILYVNYRPPVGSEAPK